MKIKVQTSAEEPPAYLNYILFDQQYKVLDAGWERIPTSANFAKQEVTLDAKYITEAGYYFTYLSYEGESNNYVYFDDYKVRHVKSNLIQANEYYPFGMQTANSWTRESVTGNRYLANGGTEMNSTTQLYDLEFRNYDPALGRMYGVDPVAAKYASLTPYNYSFNNPIGFSDPSGADPDLTNTPPANQYYFHNGNGASGYPGLTYDDWIPQNTRGEYNNAFGWRTDFTLGWFGGSGSSLNAASFAYQDRLYKAQAMAGAVTNALSGPDGETYMTVSDGLITGTEFRSTLQLQREWGGEIAREKYGGNGRMPAGYMPANHRPRIALRPLNIVLATLPRAQGVTPRKGMLILYRMTETNLSTISALESADGAVSGFSLEPTGPSTTVANQNQRIPAGKYSVIPWNSPTLGDVFLIYNDQVPQSRRIYFHTGNTPDDTVGCVLPGTTYGTNRVDNSSIMFQSLGNYIRNHVLGTNLIIVDPLPGEGN